MKGRSRFAAVLLVCGLLGAGLGTLLVLELHQDDTPGAAPVAAWLPAYPTAASASVAAVDPTGPWVATILARPLFEPQRRPRTAVAAAEPGAQEMPRLAGVMIGPFGRIAIFDNPGGGKPLVVGEGGQVNAYVVQSVTPEETTILGPDGRRVLRISAGDLTAASRIAITVSDATQPAQTGAAEPIPSSFARGTGTAAAEGLLMAMPKENQR
jgi:hypothetical protein